MGEGSATGISSSFCENFGGIRNILSNIERFDEARRSEVGEVHEEVAGVLMRRLLKWIMAIAFVLSTATWGLSYWHDAGAYVERFTVGIESGELFFGKMAPQMRFAGGWWTDADPGWDPMALGVLEYKWHGFGLQPYGKLHEWGYPVGYVYVPLWFCTVVMGVAGLLLRRNGRSWKREFPVERGRLKGEHHGGA